MIFRSVYTYYFVNAQKYSSHVAPADNIVQIEARIFQTRVWTILSSVWTLLLVFTGQICDIRMIYNHIENDTEILLLCAALQHNMPCSDGRHT